MASILEWNWNKNHVNGAVIDGNYIAPESSIICAGPPLLSMVSETTIATTLNTLRPDQTNVNKGLLVPLARSTSIEVSQERGTESLFEIGAKRAYIIPGKVAFRASIRNFMMYGPSLMRVLYALQPNPTNPNQMSPINTSSQYGAMFPTNYKITPGYGVDAGSGVNKDFYIALASELCNIPIGLCIFFRTTMDRAYGAVYLEECQITNHSFNMAAESMVIGEDLSLVYSMLLPVNVSSVR